MKKLSLGEAETTLQDIIDGLDDLDKGEGDYVEVELFLEWLRDRLNKIR